MAKSSIITGLDVGTGSIKALSAVKRPDSLDLEVLGRVQVPVLGMRRGIVAKIEEVSGGIHDALLELQNLTGQKIEEVYTNIGGNHISSISSHGTVAVSRADRKISEEDVSRVVQAARSFSVPSNQEILDVFPREFIIDGQGQIKEALGMQGIRLEVEILALCAFSPFYKNLTSAVLNAGFQIADIMPSPLASARAVLDPRQKELGAAVLDIGFGTTGLAVYGEGDLMHLAVFPIGSSHITNDIAVGLKCDIDVAEKIKLEFGSCIQEPGRKIDKINIPQDDVSLAFSHKSLVEIVEARVLDIFDQANKELKNQCHIENLQARL